MGPYLPPEVLAAQLDRLLGVVDMDTVHRGIVPLDADLPLTLGNSFCALDDRLVVEDWHAELWLDDAETIALYRRVWDTFAESAVFRAEAPQVIARVRGGIKV
ncbi:Scr1 family TA system antitoxin-like transcriptional regulator [Streptomyces hirsutus]|uniref:Scr1 family TA system antitoxin-like transcriptional regulator n=1 Tax=Streptomyces hirsutus TaxID=35620 RepID=UPI0030B810CB